MKTRVNNKLNVLSFVIPNWAMCSLINGDFSSNSDTDDVVINNFIQKTVSLYGNANFSLPDDAISDLGFRHSNDIDNQGSDCSLLYLVPNK